MDGSAAAHRRLPRTGPLPTFSVVIPVYNRAALVGRAIASCLTQPHGAFEVIVVDDGSTDGTPAAVRAIADARLRLLAQPVNRGVSPARNRGIEDARGDWIICLDSDDELTRDALAVIERHVAAVADDVHAFRFMCRFDDGSLSPVPPLRREIWGYEGYVRWAAGMAGRTDTLLCVRRRTFAEVTFPDDQAREPLYHMDFAARFRTATSPDVVLQCHGDAGNQLTRPNAARALAAAPDQARSFELLLDRHGPALARWAPRLLVQYTRGLCTQRLLAGNRRDALRVVPRILEAGSVPLSTWAILAMGLVNPRLLAHAQAQRTWRGAST